MTEKLIEHRLGAVEQDVSEIKDAVKSIAESLKTLAALEVRHSETRDGLGRAFAQIEDHERRLKSVEVEMPGLKNTSSDVRRMMWLVISIVVVAVVGMVITK